MKAPKLAMALKAWKDVAAWQKTHVATVTAIGNALYGFDCDNTALARDHVTPVTYVLVEERSPCP